jgi:hypothetical protein
LGKQHASNKVTQQLNRHAASGYERNNFTTLDNFFFDTKKLGKFVHIDRLSAQVFS